MASAQQLFQKVYEQSQAAGAGAGAGFDPNQAAGGNGNAGSAPDDDVVDGDFREV